MEGIDFQEAVRHLPIIEGDDAIGADIPAYNDWVRHPTPDDYWDPISIEDEVQSIRAPALLIGGWYDYYLELMLDDFNRMVASAGSDEARKTQILIGPWTHQSVSQFEEVDFGSEAGFLQQIATLFRWYDHWLKDSDNGITREGPVRLFIMGKNEWRMEKEWPLARTRYTPLYLHSEGAANSSQGDGTLDTNPPEGEPPDRFTYDPAGPVDSLCCFLCERYGFLGETGGRLSGREGHPSPRGHGPSEIQGFTDGALVS
jgi:putative CocE/NonD family hydrolase